MSIIQILRSPFIIHHASPTIHYSRYSYLRFMYSFSYYKEHDKEVVLQFMREHPFVFLTGMNAENKPVATQVPVFIDERDGKFFITGHIMRNTDHHKGFAENPNVLAVFTGPHTYVSATWYTNPHMGSTWNYMSVHARGVLKYLDENALIAIMKRLTLHYEKGNTGSSTVFDNLPKEYTDKMIKGIDAFEIEVEELEHVFKLSQNRDEKSYDNIIEKLKQQGGDAERIADIMEKRKDKVYKS